MRTLNLSGIVAGDSLNISVSQNAITAGPVNIPSWGGTTPTGEISINVFQSTTKLNPESVGFTVDLSLSDFDTTGPGEGEYYDARMHDLIYIWDFDDDSYPTWAAPDKYLTEWNNRNRGLGPSVQHLYLDPRPASGGAGSGYNPGVLIVEPSSGKWASATVEVFVEDADAYYSGSNTILVNNIGDNDWTWANANMPNADQINLDTISQNATEIIAREGGTGKRWLFKRGKEFTFHWDMSSLHTQVITFGAYGDPNDPRPILKGAAGGDDRDEWFFRVFVGFPETTPEYRFMDLDIRGNWDDELWTMYHPHEGTDFRAFYMQSHYDIVLHNVDISGYRIPFAANTDGNREKKTRTHFDDVTFSKFGGQYPMLCSTMRHPETSFSFTGFSFKQSPGGTGYTYGSGVGKGNGSLIRYENAKRSYFACCDFFNKDGLYHTLKPINTTIEDGGILNVHHVYGEGGNGLFTIGTNTIAANKAGRLGSGEGHGRSHVTNTIIDGVIYVGNENCVQPMQTCNTGMTIRNMLYIQPQIPEWVNSHESFLNAMRVGDNPGDSRQDPVPQHVDDAPINVYNCAMVFSLDHDPGDPIWLRQNDVYYPGHTFPPASINADMNNYIHAPNVTPALTADGPITSNVLFTPQSLGYTCPQTYQPEFSPSVDVADGESFLYPYGDLNIDGHGGIAKQEYFAQAGDFANLFNLDTNARYYETPEPPATSDMTITYGATGATITNTSGETWLAAHTYRCTMDMGASRPVLTAWAPPAGSIIDGKPGTGSAALSDASTAGGDKVAFLDITGQFRGPDGVYTLPNDVDRGPWQVS